MHEDSLVEGMKELMPVYCVIGTIPVWRIEKKRNLPIKTYKLLTIKLLYSMFLINYYIGAFVWK